MSDQTTNPPDGTNAKPPPPQPVQQPKTVIVSLVLYLTAVAIWATVETYGVRRWTIEGYRDYRLYTRVIEPYRIITIEQILLLTGLIFAIIALFQHHRKRWPALVAIILWLTFIAMNGFVNFPTHP